MRSLKKYLVAYAPMHVYFSALNWLFPERVGKKYKANKAVPLNGEYVVDVDSCVLHRWHNHVSLPAWNICPECIWISKMLTIQACDAIQRYYSKLAIVFSGKGGFHIHVLDFDYHDWARYNEKDPIKTHETARFKFSKAISLQTYVFDRAHFILSVDPMRVLSLPTSLNAETGLICSHIGSKKDLEYQKVSDIIARARPLREVCGYPEPPRGSETPRIKQGWGNIARVTAMTPQPKTRFVEKRLVD